MTPRSLFRAAAVAELVTWTLLIAGMVLKYGLDAGDWGVRIGGSVHGFVFLAYLVVTTVVAVNQRWSAGALVLGWASAVVPYATVPFEVAVARRGMLEGPCAARGRALGRVGPPAVLRGAPARGGGGHRGRRGGARVLGAAGGRAAGAVRG